MSSSDAGSKSARSGKTPVMLAAHAMLRGFRARPAIAAARVARHAPWPRSVRTAKAGCQRRFAKPGAAVLAASLASSPQWQAMGNNPLPASRVPEVPRKNPGRCDLLHISLVGPGLDPRHEQRDPNLIRRAGRPPHRLRPDRHRRRRGPDCAGLPPAGLKPAPKAASRASFRALFDTSAPQSIRFTAPGFIRGAAAATSIAGRVPQKSVKRGACCDRQSSTILMIG